MRVVGAFCLLRDNAMASGISVKDFNSACQPLTP